MGWYAIKNYSYVKYVDLNSDVRRSDGVCIIMADDNPFCIQIQGEGTEREYRLLKNDFCIMLMGTPYRIHTDPGTETRIISLELKSDHTSGKYHSISALFAAYPEVKKLVGGAEKHLVGCGSEALKEIILLIQHCHEKATKQESAFSAADHLIAALFTQAADDIYGKGSGTVLCAHTKKALSYISKNYQKDISVATLAEFIGISTRRLQSLFKEELETTVSDYLKSFRISRACDMLRSTNIPVNEIAGAVGYNSRQHFTCVFKEFTGVSPQQFRQNSKNRNYRFSSEALCAEGPGFLSFVHTKSDLDIV